MIRNRWYAIASSCQVPHHAAIRVDRLGCDLELSRDDAGAIRCVGRSSPGAVREARGFVWAWWGDDDASLPQPPWFAGLDETFVWSERRAVWPVHVSRAVENQLDFAHLPFVHRPVHRGRSPELPITTRVDGDRIVAWTGSEPRLGTRLELLGPGLWRLVLSADVQLFAAFCPIDEYRTATWLRTYRRRDRMPGLDWLALRAGQVFDRALIAQDQVIVAGGPQSLPLRAGGDECRTPAGPIVEYRRWRTRNGAAARHRVAVVDESPSTHTGH